MVFDELGLMLVDVLFQMQDGWFCQQCWRILHMMLLKVVLLDDEHEVCCIAFLLVDVVLQLLVEDVLQVVVQQEEVVPVLVVLLQVDVCTGCPCLMLRLFCRRELPNLVVLM